MDSKKPDSELSPLEGRTEIPAAEDTNPDIEAADAMGAALMGVFQSSLTPDGKPRLLN